MIYKLNAKLHCLIIKKHNVASILNNKGIDLAQDYCCFIIFWNRIIQCFQFPTFYLSKSIVLFPNCNAG